MIGPKTCEMRVAISHRISTANPAQAPAVPNERKQQSFGWGTAFVMGAKLFRGVVVGLGDRERRNATPVVKRKLKNY